MLHARPTLPIYLVAKYIVKLKLKLKFIKQYSSRKYYKIQWYQQAYYFPFSFQKGSYIINLILHNQSSIFHINSYIYIYIRHMDTI